jgi:hypothetical protein
MTRVVALVRTQHAANTTSIVGHTRARGTKVNMVRFSGVGSYHQPYGVHLTAQEHAMLAQRLLPQVAAALGRAR